MPDQYDGIASSYDKLSKMAPERIEHVNVERLIEPRIQGKNVLELACGLGLYSRRMIDLGANSVIAKDISNGMVEGAKAASSAEAYNSKITYEVADCSKPTNFEGGPFDMVLAAWLVNYAPDEESMAETFRTALVNLKPGGVFVGTCMPPWEDIEAELEERHRIRPKQRGIIWYEKTGEVKDGLKTEVQALLEDNEDDNVKFNCYHLKKSVHERAAKTAGFTALEWQKLEVPVEFQGRPDEDFLRSIVATPDVGVFVATTA